MTNARIASSNDHATANPPTIATRIRTASTARGYRRVTIRLPAPYTRQMKRLLAATALLALALTGAASGGHARAAGTVSSTRLVMDGHIRIAATVATPVRVGHPLKVTYRVTNVSAVTRKIKLGFAFWYVVHAQDGTTYDTRVAFGAMRVPYIPPTKLRPGQTVTRNGDLIRVRWDGPLRITPGWANDSLPKIGRASCRGRS